MKVAAAAPRAPAAPAATIIPEPVSNWRPDSERFRLLAGILIALFAVYAIAFIAISAGKGWPEGFGDSFALWSWARFLAEHPAIAIYDPAALRPAQLALGMNAGASYPFAYPPTYLPMLRALGLLPGAGALALLMAVTLPLYLWATLGREWRAAALAAALAAPTTTITIVSGQSGFLAAGLLAGGLRLAAERPVAAGVLFGLLTFKPQLGLLLPVALLAARQWRSIVAAALTAALLAVATSLWFGAAVWPAWLAAIPGFSRQVAAESSEILHLMPTVLAALVRLGVAPGAAQAAQWGMTAAAGAAVWYLFRPGPGALASAGLMVAALLAAPYAFVYDMPVLATALIWVVAERHRAGAGFATGEILVMMFTMLAPIVMVAGTSKFPLAPLSLLALLGSIVYREWCRRRLAFAPQRREE